MIWKYHRLLPQRDDTDFGNENITWRLVWPNCLKSMGQYSLSKTQKPLHDQVVVMEEIPIVTESHLSPFCKEWNSDLYFDWFRKTLWQIDLLCLGCWVCSDYEIQGPVRNVVGQNLGFPFWLFPFQDFLFFFRGHGLPGFGLLVFQAIKATVLFVYFFVLVPLPLLMPQCLGPG